MPRSKQDLSKKHISAEVCILGAGPAGLAAAWEMARAGVTDVVVLERQEGPGGLARTESFRDLGYDLGPHRFFTSNKEVKQLWREVLGEDFQPVQRLTRIFYRDRFFRYPIAAADALPKLGLWQAGLALASFARAQLGPAPGQARSFDEWVSASFGPRLYETFFKVYTEKVWGVPCREISADWAAQRIKGLDLWGVARRALRFGGGRQAKTLAEEFDYPRLGAGQMSEQMRRKLEEAGLRFYFNREIQKVHLRGDRIIAVEVPGMRVEAGHFLSSIPITSFINSIQPKPEEALLRSSERLGWRDHITVDLDVEGEALFPDQWIYVHDPGVKMARLANYANFSTDMAAAGRTPVSVEYFCFRDDALWRMADEDLVDLAKDELSRMGLLSSASVAAGRVRREAESYPSYVLGWRQHFEPLRRFVDSLSNLQAIGRGGMFKYNNMDHSVYSGILAARNLWGADGAPFDLWRINIDAKYQEAAVRSV